jgi:hypothetical protein
MTKLKLIKHRRLWQGIALLILDLVFFGTTDANSTPAYAVIIGFVLIIFSLYILLYCLLSLARLYGLPLKHKKRLSIVLTSVIGGMIALQSISELSPRDVLVLLPLAALAYVYITYNKENSTKRIS